MSQCSCGEIECHVMARRRTEDGRQVILWSDGMLTWGFGFRIRGAGAARSAYQRRLNVAAGWAVIDVCDMLPAGEVERAVAVARREAALDARHGVDLTTARLSRRILLRLGEAA